MVQWLLAQISAKHILSLLHMLAADSALRYYECAQVAGTSGRVRIEGGDDDEGPSTEAHSAAITEALGMEVRNEVCHDGTLVFVSLI